MPDSVSDHEEMGRPPYVRRDQAVGKEYQDALGNIRSSAKTRRGGVPVHMTPQRFAAEGVQPAQPDLAITDLPVRRKKFRKAASGFKGTPTGDDLESWRRAHMGDTMLSTSELSLSSDDNALAGPADSTSMSQLQPEFEQLGIDDMATSRKEIYIFEGSQLDEVVTYLPMPHQLATERFKSVPNHTVCIRGTYESVQKRPFRTPKVRMHVIANDGRVIRDARGWYFSRLCVNMPMSAVEHVFTQIMGRNVENYDRSTSSDPDRQKLKLINRMLQFIWPVIENMHHVVGRGVVYCWHVMLCRSSGR